MCFFDKKTSKKVKTSVHIRKINDCQWHICSEPGVGESDNPGYLKSKDGPKVSKVLPLY